MGSTIAQCTKLLSGDSDNEYMQYDGHSFDYRAGGMHGPQPASQGPLLALRICQAPVEASHGAKLSPFAIGDEVAVVQVEKLKGWDALRWRQERSATQRAAVGGASGLAWPSGPRFSNAQRFWGAKVVSSDGQNGFEEHWCLLQIAVSQKERTMENAKADIEDAKDVAAYAHRFNMQTALTFGVDDPSSVPGVKVCAPAGSIVIGSSAPDLANTGEAVLLVWFPSPQVTKFVFDGSEDFLELPQAFFHFVAWQSGGRDQAVDLQGAQDGDDVFLIDPVLLRSPQVSIGAMLGGLASNALQGGSSASPEQGQHEERLEDRRFEVCHPRCGQLCRGFDPQRRTAHSRKHCGLNLPSCGVGGA